MLPALPVQRLGVVMFRSVTHAILGCCLLAALVNPAAAQSPPQGPAQDKRANQAGQFDFYVLSLSWSPSFCAAAAERAPGQAPPAAECGTHAYSFIVHGLWPQYENGFPQDCQVPAPRLDRTMISAMLDLMPAPQLIFSAWDRHGTCSGLSSRVYFDTLRRARAQVTIPAEYLDLQQPLNIRPAAVRDAFIKANPGLASGDIAVSCDNERLTEVRLCLSKELKFRACPDVVARSCQRQQVQMPAPHGSATGTAAGDGSG
jgi:ribonuclease T2